MAEPHRKQATLHDVARLASVSHQTVSRVINLSPNVSAETKERVQKAIDILNYRPNRAARSLITGRSHLIQILDFEAGYITPIPTIVSTASDLGYRTGVSILRYPSLSELRILLDDLTSWLVDGIVLFDPQFRLDPVELKRMCRGIPFIQLGGEPAPGIPSVIFDQAGGQRQVMDHLFSLGHQRVSEISGPLHFYDSRTRHQTYLEWFRTCGVGPEIWVEGNFTAALAYTQTQWLLDKGNFTALVCSNDETALGALRALRERGLRVPEDISVVGFDDHAAVRFYDPPLTTVRQDTAELSRVGIEDLIARIEDPDRQVEQKVLLPTLVVRESTGKILSG